jgi:hypothetical protein
MLLVDYPEMRATITQSTMLHFSTNWSSNWSPNVEASFRKESCFFKTMLIISRYPFWTRNWQIFTLMFWNTRPSYLIWPLQTTESFLTSRETVFKYRWGNISCEWVVCRVTNIISLGSVKEVWGEGIDEWYPPPH